MLYAVSCLSSIPLTLPFSPTRRRRDLPTKGQGPPQLPVPEGQVTEDYKKALYGYSRQSSKTPNSDIYWSRRSEGPMTENEYASIQDGFPPVSPTGSGMPEVEFSALHGQSAFPPPPYGGREGQHPGHFNTGSRQKRAEVSPPHMRGLDRSTTSLDMEGREYFVLDPEEARGHKMIHMSER